MHAQYSCMDGWVGGGGAARPLWLTGRWAGRSMPWCGGLLLPPAADDQPQAGCLGLPACLPNS